MPQGQSRTRLAVPAFPDRRRLDDEAQRQTRACASTLLIGRKRSICVHQGRGEMGLTRYALRRPQLAQTSELRAANLAQMIR
jgi:hypothetical protein